MLAIAPLCFFDPDNAGKREPRRSRKQAEVPTHDSRLYCARCRQPVTDTTERLDINGNAEHACTNPLGITFHIRCFRRAPGCAADGIAITEHTWFPGYAWRVAYCSHCGAHLGWLFESPSGDGFYGLIVDRLRVAGRG